MKERKKERNEIIKFTASNFPKTLEINSDKTAPKYAPK